LFKKKKNVVKKREKIKRKGKICLKMAEYHVLWVIFAGKIQKLT
jgi:hypothetical protein